MFTIVKFIRKLCGAKCTLLSKRQINNFKTAMILRIKLLDEMLELEIPSDADMERVNKILSRYKQETINLLIIINNITDDDVEVFLRGIKHISDPFRIS